MKGEWLTWESTRSIVPESFALTALTRVCVSASKRAFLTVRISSHSGSLLEDQSAKASPNGSIRSCMHGCVLRATPKSDVPLPWSETMTSTCGCPLYSGSFGAAAGLAANAGGALTSLGAAATSRSGAAAGASATGSGLGVHGWGLGAAAT